MGLFCQNLVIMAYNLENYSNFKVKIPKVGIFLKYIIILEVGGMPDLMICLK